MTGKIIDGKSISEEIRKELKARAERLCSKGTQARLDIILVGNNPASEIYVNSKIEKAKDIWILAELHRFPGTAKQEEVVKLVNKLN